MAVRIFTGIKRRAVKIIPGLVKALDNVSLALKTGNVVSHRVNGGKRIMKIAMENRSLMKCLFGTFIRWMPEKFTAERRENR